MELCSGLIRDTTLFDKGTELGPSHIGTQDIKYVLSNNVKNPTVRIKDITFPIKGKSWPILHQEYLLYKNVKVLLHK